MKKPEMMKANIQHIKHGGITPTQMKRMSQLGMKKIVKMGNLKPLHG